MQLEGQQPKEDRVKVRVQLTQLCSERPDYSLQIDRNAVVVLAPPQPLTFAFDSAHEPISKVHYNAPLGLYDDCQDEVNQLLIGVNTCIMFMGHETFKKHPHDITDGFLSKLFNGIFAGVDRQMTSHHVTVKAQFVACSNSTRETLKHYADLLSTSGDVPYSAYSSLSSYDAVFDATSVTLDRPEDGVNCYVMGLHQLQAHYSQAVLTEVSSIFVVDVIQAPRMPDDVPFASKLFIVTLPCYTNAGTGDALSRFTMFTDDVLHTYEGGRAVVNTTAPKSNDPLHEILIGEGLIGGNCTTTLVLLLEAKAATDVSTVYKILDRTSKLRDIVSTPLINDAQTLLYTTRMKNAYNLFRQICTENGRAVPLNEFDKYTIRHEVQLERIKGQLVLYTERCEKLQSELVDSERERLHLARTLERLKETGDVQQSAQHHTNEELMERLTVFEKELLRTKMEAEVRREVEDKGRETDAEKQEIEKEYMSLRANYDHLQGQNTEIRNQNTELREQQNELNLKNTTSADEIVRLKDELETCNKNLEAQQRAHDEKIHRAEERNEIHILKLEAALAQARDQEPQADNKVLLQLQAQHIQELRSLIKGDSDAYDVFSTAVDDLLDMVHPGGGEAPKPDRMMLQRQARHSRQLLELETELAKAKDKGEESPVAHEDPLLREELYKLRKKVRDLKQDVSAKEKAVSDAKQKMLSVKTQHVAELRSVMRDGDAQEAVLQALDELLQMIECDADTAKAGILQRQARHTKHILDLEARLKEAVKNTTHEMLLPEDPQCSFKDFLSGPYQDLVREREDLRARAFRAEAERDQMEQNLIAKIELFQREKNQMQADLASARAGQHF